MTKRQRKCLMVTGLLTMLCGVGILSVFGYQRISRELYKRKLLRESIVFEVPDLEIRAPVLEGTDKEVLAVAAGHFPDTGSLGSGNYCICGHNSTIYACIFNRLPEAEPGMKMYLYDTDEARTCYTYEITEHTIIEPQDTWVLNDFGDHRLTVLTCTDDGTQRHLVVGRLLQTAQT